MREVNELYRLVDCVCVHAHVQTCILADAFIQSDVQMMHIERTAEVCRTEMNMRNVLYAEATQVRKMCVFAI